MEDMTFVQPFSDSDQEAAYANGLFARLRQFCPESPAAGCSPGFLSSLRDAQSRVGEASLREREVPAVPLVS